MDWEADLKLVYVKWLDPHSVDPWTAHDELQVEPYVVYSFGIFLRETTSTIALSLNRASESMDASCIMVIPKNAIVDIKEIKAELKKWKKK